MSHGGDIYRNKVKTDLSVSVNPLGCPESVMTAMQEALSSAEKYPDIRHERLIDALAELTGVSGDRILLGNGASELIMTILRYFSGRRVFLPVPSFIGYRYALEAAGCRVEEYLLRPDDNLGTGYAEENLEKCAECFSEYIRENASAGDVILLTNPNNPTGKLVPEDELQNILSVAAEKNAYIITDECFMTLTGRGNECSALKYISENGLDGSNCTINEVRIGSEYYDKLLIIDAFTKTFAIPGVRLGMAYFGDAELAEKIRRLLPEWNISCVAEAAGLEAVSILKEFGDVIKELENNGKMDPYNNMKKAPDNIRENYIAKSIEYINRERNRIISMITEPSQKDDLNSKHHVEVFPSDANFILIKTDKDIYEYMLSRGILIRDCSDFVGLGKGYYRISISSEENDSVFIREFRGLNE
ncbi:MAG: aminotransferase class I/II-fold pyridoxal phosphate-dependent enzyme [Eubacterium sp.]|nr:aminotransferase class I/II-fold pyridoxal phosphate-dependent enzyme [Eubacterium sp.]